VAVMVNKFVETTQNTNKTQLVASNYGTFWALVVCEIFYTPKQTLYSGHQCDKLRKNVKRHLKSSATFLAIKRCEGTKIGKAITKLNLKAGTYMRH
jgi:uncharacterized membrane protein